MDFFDAAWSRVDPVAVALAGEETCRERLEAWLATELSRCADEAWAERFAAACPFPGAEPRDYLQRVVVTPRGAALVGIRMRGGDVSQPFVDVLVAAGPLDELIAAALEDLATFRPRVARVRCPGTCAPPLPARVDQWLCAGHVPMDASGPLALATVDDPDVALAFVEAAYRDWGVVRPELVEEIHPIQRDELDACTEAHGAFWITAGGQRIGLLCVVPATEREWSGWLVVEEVILPAHAGRGYAAASQRALSARLGGALLWGTISGVNEASLRTAARAGRPAVGAWWWVGSGNG